MQTFDDLEALALMWLGLMFLVGSVGAMIASAIQHRLNRRRPMAVYKGKQNVR